MKTRSTYVAPASNARAAIHLWWAKAYWSRAVMFARRVVR